MKKLSVILLAMLLTATVITGCTSNTHADGENEIVATPEDTLLPTPELDANGDDEPVVNEPVVDDEPVVDEPVIIPADVESMSASQVLDAIDKYESPDFMHGQLPVDITNPQTLKMFTGLDSAEGIVEVAVDEALIGSQAYSLVVVKVEDPANAKTIAEAIYNGIDTRKWICVEADDTKAAGKGNTVMFVMVDSEFKDTISAASVTEAFKTVCGGSLDFEI